MLEHEAAVLQWKKDAAKRRAGKPPEKPEKPEARRIMANDTTIGSHMRLLAKDTRLAMASAHQVGYAGWLGEAAAKAFALACEQGMTDMDDSNMLAFIRRAADPS
ncbi:MAG: hypothetical protein EB110_03570 [Betaproteobacteria bacterium]|nr:hypothetical protein [Betaproteobacteria bacterium]